MLVGGPSAQFPSAVIKWDVWVGSAVILRCGKWWSFRVCAQIVTWIPIRRSGTRSIMGWQINADASGFALRERIIAALSVPVGGGELTL
jgi:hypothetical protein